MGQDNISSNKIKENKYKILRMSLLLGQGEDKEDTINNFEDASREIDSMNDEIYLKDLEGKFYDTLTLEEEEKKLAVLVDYIGGRVEQRMSLLSDFSNVTGFELLNLPPIKYYDKLDEYKERLSYIREYLSNTKNINSLNQEISELENKLNDAYVRKAKAEEKNIKDEQELLTKFESIIKKREEFKDITVENAPLKLEDKTLEVQDSKKSLEIFNKSFKTLNEAGISGEEEQEYLSYVNGAKEAYYNNKEQEYLLKLYIALNSAESEYNKILVKRDSINDTIYERIELRKELEITDEDILSKIYTLLERQYDDIIKQKDNIENIEYLNKEIINRKDMVNELEKDNQKVEILSLLKEFCIIDTYDTENDTKIKENTNAKKEEITINNTPTTEIKEKEPEERQIADSDIITTSQEKVNPTKKEDITFDLPKPNTTKETENEISKVEENVEQTIEKEDIANAAANQVISVEDATKINIEASTIKSNNVMKRVGEMLGVKIEKPKTPDIEIKQQDKFQDNINNTESIKTTPSNNPIFDNNTKTQEKISDNEKTNTEVEFTNNIFETDFNADPEINEELSPTNHSILKEENPLFNNNLANKTIDDIMTNKNLPKEDPTNENNDFWFASNEAPMDLSSLPDISPETDNKNNFFGDNNNFINELEFPNLNMNFNEKEESNEN